MKSDLINAVLPDELIEEIFGHLESKLSRDACSLVCKRWLSLERLSRFSISISSSTPESYIRLLSTVFVNLRSVYIDERRTMSLPVLCVRL
ncbi:F-box/LRR-repeat protein 4-like [Dorcoceras hygrometricum]|uniref:F-box/LRR-repeat protein 4-like n=1 Tax=Dorcoceras hygrometricum TaxID=472368 RepID=A0A2Z7CTW1_9LAMI|nr:F-box/LRR-repeat protein 4-like [Dorcoceras hygrometricum]